MRGFQYKDKEGVEMFQGKSYVNEFYVIGSYVNKGFYCNFILKFKKKYFWKP